MLTVLTVNGYRFYFYASDRSEPKHIHVARGDGYGKVWLEPEVEMQYMIYFKRQEKKEIIGIINENERY